ncbi:hypothetical protein SteCoe_27784 [Stentor coeruleus]|uniref:Uncharacterized protein n=1 Tax=Stentor coeruleus TaxID=5963 RepID=A0A1R2B9Q7_9CILI|nr:hypothetical protein SteCoe_27784 [Stentor coeruleus]
MRMNDIFEGNNYLIYFGPPFETCCSCYTLKRGANIVAYLDIAAGFIYLIIWFVYMINVINQVDILLSLAIYLLCIPGILVSFFAFLAVRSLERANYIPFYLYSKLKIFEFILVTLMSFIIFFMKISSFEFIDVLDLASNIIYNFFTSKLTWSTAKWLKNNEEAIQSPQSDEWNDILKQNLNPSGANDISASVELM